MRAGTGRRPGARLRRVLGMVLCGALWALAPGGAARAFDGIRITLLGTGAHQPVAARGAPATLVEAGAAQVLVDCGAGTVERLQRAGVAPGLVETVLLSSLQAGHTEGLQALWLAGAGARPGVLRVLGPAGTEQRVREMQALAQPAIAARIAAGGVEGLALEVEDIAENLVYDRDGVVVTAVVLDGGAFGYRVDRGGRAVLLATEGGAPQALRPAAAHAQVVLQGVMDAHGATASAAQDAEAAAALFRVVRPVLAVYTHVGLDADGEAEMMRRTRRIYAGPLVLGHDLMRIELQMEVQVRSLTQGPP